VCIHWLVRLSDLTGHDNAVNGLSFSSDGRLLATGDGDYTARIWDVTFVRTTAARRPVERLRP
jgi:WD40 repeat protein